MKPKCIRFRESTINEILRQVAAGNSLISVLESNASYPSRPTWSRWISEDPILSSKYVAAIQQQVAARYALK